MRPARGYLGGRVGGGLVCGGAGKIVATFAAAFDRAIALTKRVRA